MPKFSPLIRAGWPVLPLARDGAKHPLVSGHHGKDRVLADEATVRGWAKSFPDCNPGIVLPDNVIGFDVDGPSHGVDGLLALAEFERKFSPLPEAGWIFHGTDEDGSPSPYGTRLYRVPDSMLDVYTPGRVVGNLNKVTGVPGVDVIAPWLRYNVAPGAVHSSGEVYEFAGSPMPGIPWLPRPEELPELTRKQVAGLLKRPRTDAVAPGHLAKPIGGVEPLLAGRDRAEALLAQTRALAALPEGQTLMIEGEERGWQRGDGFFVLACALVRLAKHPEKARSAFVSAAGEYEDAERQWDNAVAAVAEEEPEETTLYRVPPMGVPRQFAAEYLDRHHRTDEGVLRLRFNQGQYWLWEDTHYRPLDGDEVQAILEADLDGAMHRSADGPQHVIVRTALVSELLSRLKALTLVSRHGGGALLPATGGVPFQNGWLDVETGALGPIGPDRDLRWVVPADYDPEATCPEWFKFLDSIGWAKGSDERKAIRQWLGHLISGSTDLHKGVLLVGPKRAGKGTVLAVAEALLGDGAIGLQLDNLATNFGLMNMIGKGLATIGDARFGFRTDKAIIERLLSLTSFDSMQIDVKYDKPVNTRPTARLMIASNEPPKFIEASDALASRFLIFEFVKSFYGREDLGLKRRILAELPGIARWAMGGYRELIGQGAFSETSAGLKMQQQMVRDSAPIRVFVEEHCLLSPDVSVESQKLYAEYAVWAERNGMFKLDRQAFFRDLNTAFPGQIEDFYPRIGGKQIRSKRGIRLERGIS